MRRRWREMAGIWALLLASACCVAAQSKNPDDLGSGKVLVAATGQADPLFARTVILLVRYDENGALGLIVNLQTRVPLARVLPGVKEAAGDSDPVFVGGPVDLHKIFALARAGRLPDGGKRVVGDVYFFADAAGLESELKRALKPSEFRVYVGYSGWGPGQLDREVQDGGWYIFGGSQDLAFDTTPSTLWLRLVGRTQGQIAFLGGFDTPGR